MSLEPWKPQRIGNLRERIILRQPGEETQNELGEPVMGPPIDHNVFARVEPLKGREVLEAGGIAGSHDIVFHVRYRADVTVLWEVVWNGTTYNITATRNTDERRRFLAIEAAGPSE